MRRRATAIGLAFNAVMWATAQAALAQAYTYQEPTCGGTWRDEPSKPQELRVVWEMSAAQACVQQSKFPIACRHLRDGIVAADRMGAESGSPDGIKSFMKTMMRTHGCQ
jgi:hypothetical protein